jgi:hypothetical protein
VEGSLDGSDPHVSSVVAAPSAAVRKTSRYDVTSDGQRFLRVQPMHPDPPTHEIQVGLNWFEELKRLVPTKWGAHPWADLALEDYSCLVAKSLSMAADQT